MTGELGADDLELGYPEPGDETKWQCRPADQMPIA
jgi:hypothetical protein